VAGGGDTNSGEVARRLDYPGGDASHLNSCAPAAGRGTVIGLIARAERLRAADDYRLICLFTSLYSR
jgi:hypothetical protein